MDKPVKQDNHPVLKQHTGLVYLYCAKCRVAGHIDHLIEVDDVWYCARCAGEL